MNVHTALHVISDRNKLLQGGPHDAPPRSGRQVPETHLCSVRTLTADGWLAQYARYKVFICGIRFKKQPPTLC